MSRGCIVLILSLEIDRWSCIKDFRILLPNMRRAFNLLLLKHHRIQRAFGAKSWTISSAIQLKTGMHSPS